MELRSYVAPPLLGVPRAAVSPELQERAIGAAVARLLVLWPEWIKRRVESVRFTDDATVRRQMSVDFELPESTEPLDEPAPTAIERCARAVLDMTVVTATPVLPLTTLEKATLERGRLNAGFEPQLLTRFDLWDDAWGRLPMLSKSDSARVTGAGLAMLANIAADSLGIDFSDPLSQYFHAIAGQDAADARYLLQHARTGFRAAVRKLGAHPNRDFAAFVTRLYGREAEIEQLLNANNEFLRSLCGKLASSFILLVPLGGDLYRRRIIKIAYEASLRRKVSGNGVRRRLAGIAQSCSWLPLE